MAVPDIRSRFKDSRKGSFLVLVSEIFTSSENWLLLILRTADPVLHAGGFSQGSLPGTAVAWRHSFCEEAWFLDPIYNVAVLFQL